MAVEVSKIKRDDGSSVNIGDRLICDEHTATILYVGQVPPTKDDWIGVEWDNPERGKHDGTHEGHTYFKTSHPKSGSFIRPKKATFGVSFMTAVRSRYGRIEEENAGVITEELYVRGSKNQQTVVEMVGARKVNDQQSKLDALQEVVLRGEQVYGSPSTDNLSILVPSIVSLDISQNLVSSWQQVGDITCQLKNLKSLNVSDNRLVIPANPSALVEKLCHVTVLYVNRMNYSWNEILECTTMFPQLEQLHACFNNIQKLSSAEGRLPHARLVNLESNDISDWAEILKLGHLAHLNTLIVSENNLSKVFFNSDGESTTTDLFKSLKALSINGNKISDWDSINELNKLANFEELRIHRNPLMDTDRPETVRQNLIAKLKNLKMCNRTEVTAEERKGAEIDYLKRFGKDWKGKPSTEFLKNHPNFQNLVKEWGAPEDSELAQKAVSLKKNLITVKISCLSLPDLEPIKKSIPGTITIGKLKALLYRVYQLDSDVINLSYYSQSMKGEEVEMDNDQRTLAYYSIEPGDEIIIKTL